VPQFVRAGLRHDRWLETEGREPLDFPADVLTDLKTIGDELSVFEVSGAITAERIAIALAAGPPKREPAKTTYAVFDREAVEQLGIEIKKTDGDTIDAAVNLVHYDVHVGTTRNLIGLAGVIARSTPISILKKDVTQLLKKGFENGQLDHTKNRVLCDKVGAQIATA
jgi:hypothetical protein